MMKIQVFSEYNKIAEAGRAKALTCPMHEDAIFSLYHKIDEHDTITLECFACSYKIKVGHQLYENIKKVVEHESITK